ncbi:hypothetical protein ACIGEZ_33945 [Streptomyces sp. NPDC085481]
MSGDKPAARVTTDVASVPVPSFGTHMSHRSVRGQRHRLAVVDEGKS